MRYTSGKLTAGTQKWRLGSDDFPLRLGIFFPFQPLIIFSGLYIKENEVITLHLRNLNSLDE